MTNQSNNPNDPRGTQPTGGGQPPQQNEQRPQQPPHQGGGMQPHQRRQQNQPPHQQGPSQGSPGQSRSGQQQPHRQGQSQHQSQRHPQQGQPQHRSQQGGSRPPQSGTGQSQQMLGGTHQSAPSQSQQQPPGMTRQGQQGMSQQGMGQQGMTQQGMGQQGMGQQTRPGMDIQRGAQPVSLEPVRMEDVAQDEVVTAETDTPVRTIAAEMGENDVGSVVVTDDDEPVGVITDRSIALQLEENPDVAQQEVQELVDGDVQTATPEMTIFEALQTMNEADVRRLPVVDENGELQGIITLDDVLVLLGTELGNAAEIIKAQSPRL